MKEPIDDCGCYLERNESGLHMVDCPLHKNARTILNILIEVKEILTPALKYCGGLESEFCKSRNGICDICVILKKAELAISLARGK